MALPFFFISYASRIIPIIATIGTALFRFMSKNPRIIGSTVSVQAVSSAIQSHEVTEKEKIRIVNEIGKQNPQLRYDLYRNIFYSGTNVVSNILPYLFILLIIYIILRKWKYRLIITHRAQRCLICSCSFLL